VNDTLFELGSYTNYANGGYNHSSALTDDGKKLVFCDEVPNHLPIKLVDVSNFSNIQPIKNFNPGPLTTPHNPYMLGNKYVVVSCYQDGLRIYDISNGPNVSETGFFDTFPQGGVNSGTYAPGAYQGNWGAYPWLPSGIIIANDMQNGVFILDASRALGSTSGIGIISNESQIMAYPNPANTAVTIYFASAEEFQVRIVNMLGATVYENAVQNKTSETINVEELPAGTYLMEVESAKNSLHKKLIISH
jgi:hypothetical protein